MIDAEGEVWSALKIVAKTGIPVIMESFVRDLLNRYSRETDYNISFSAWADGQLIIGLIGNPKGSYYNEALGMLYQLSIEGVGRQYELPSRSFLQVAFEEQLDRFNVEWDKNDPPLLLESEYDEVFMLQRWSTMRRLQLAERSQTN